MKRALVLIGALFMGVALVGCGSDPREGLVTDTTADLENAVIKVTNIKVKIDEAVKKEEKTGKTPDFAEAEKEVDALKNIAKEMQKRKMEADGLKEKTTEDERKELTKTFKNRINKAIEELSKARKGLNERMTEVESEHKGALKKVQDKLVEADAEFETIASRR